MSDADAKLYVGFWTAALLVAAWLYLRERRQFAFSTREYWRWLFVPWKVATFVVAAAGLTFIAPYSGDPTWDRVNAPLMSVLTFLTAPFAVGALWRAMTRRIPISHAYVAVCLCMLSSSWSHDFYLYLRDGAYPETWATNACASAAMYLAAGMFWNLDWDWSRGVVFAFRRNAWPRCTYGAVFLRILWPAVAFMAVVAGTVLTSVFIMGRG